MAIDTAEKRKAISAIPSVPFAVSVTPNVSKDAEWRQQVAWSYSGIPASGEVEAAVVMRGTFLMLGAGNALVLGLVGLLHWGLR